MDLGIGIDLVVVVAALGRTRVPYRSRLAAGVRCCLWILDALKVVLLCLVLSVVRCQ